MDSPTSWRSVGSLADYVSGMGHIFVSYSSDDEVVAADIVGHLERHGQQCWLASRDVDLGDDYSSQIIRAIDRSAHVIVVVSVGGQPVTTRPP